jgi:hypothetical protein
MKNLFSYFILILFFTFNTQIYAQKSLDKGLVKMEITNATSDDPQVAMGMQMMVGSQTNVYFKEKQSVALMEMMGGMIKVEVHMNSGDSTSNMLFDMMGNKIWVESKMNEMQNAQQKQIADLSVIEYDKNDTKEILGYKCYKMTITNPEMEGVKVSAYITEDIKTNANLIQGFQSLKFAGYPLEFITTTPKVAITMTTKEIKDQVDDTKFVMDTKGYKKMNMEEFTKTMGGMGGLGF